MQIVLNNGFEKVNVNALHIYLFIFKGICLIKNPFVISYMILVITDILIKNYEKCV